MNFLLNLFGKKQSLISFKNKTLIIELSAHGGKSIDTEANDLRTSFMAQRAMGHSKNILLPLILKNVFKTLSTKAIFLTDAPDSALADDNSIVTLIVQLNSASPSDKEVIDSVLRQKDYQPQDDDLFFRTLLRLPIWCGWRSPTCGRDKRVIIFPNSSSSDFSRGQITGM